MRSALAIFLAILLPCATFAQDAPYPQSAPGEPQPPQQQQQQNTPLLAAPELDNLVAPVALYPDPLLGQLLAASTYPLELVEAQQWLRQNSNLRGAALMDAAKQQNWDPSVQAMVAFPDVLTMLNRDIRWTTDLGNAFLAQQADVMAAVQRMRARAQQNGRLQSNQQQTVTTESQDGQNAIAIQPTDPQMIYPPVYNPEYIWGPPAWGYYPPLWYPPLDYGYGFGAGVFLGGFFAGLLGWGGWGWGLGWFGPSLFVNTLFFTHFGFHGGGFYGAGYGGHALWAHNPMHRMGVAYPNRALAARYSGGSRMGGGSAYRGGAYRGVGSSSASNYRGSSSRGSAAGGFRSFNSGSGFRSFNSGSRSSAAGSSARSYAPANRSAGAYRGGSQAYRSAPSYRGPAGGSAYRGYSNSTSRSMAGNYRSSAPSAHYSAPRGSSSHFSGGS
ncbi:MAG TPA: DUF3300 domain-containing protein, partial [Bryobacteraceae bacterium]|nr:DUF3300 domain-containing protein [Bryobacteraceae bacterium]